MESVCTTARVLSLQHISLSFFCICWITAQQRIVVFCSFSFTLAWSYHNSSIQLLSPGATMLCLCPLSYLTEISGLSQMKNAAFFFEGRHGPNENRLQEWKCEVRAKILNLMEGKKKKNWLHWYCDYKVAEVSAGKDLRSVCVLYRTHLSHQENETSGPNWMYLNMGKLVPNISSGCDSEDSWFTQ